MTAVNTRKVSPSASENSETELLERLRAALAHSIYRVEQTLARGGMALVCLARDTRRRRKVAVKVLLPELALNVRKKRFLREIEVVGGLTHPHILPIYDSGEADGLLYYVMPFVKDGSLRTRIEHERQLPVEDAVRITGEVAKALAFAHEHGVVHRDVKPENILLLRGHAVVCDFGIAWTAEPGPDGRLTGSGMSIGTPQYMSPEQVSKGGTVDARTDTYSLGCVLYEMLAGEPPFTGFNEQAIMARQMGEAPRSLRVVRDTVPLHIEQAVRSALAKVPADRFPTATAFADALLAGPTVGAGPSTHLPPGRLSGAPAERRTVSEEAHRLYRQGRVFWNKRLEGGLDQAMQFFREAEEKDGLYAAALAGQADCYVAWGFYEFRPPRVTYPAALDAAERALQLDPGLTEAHAAKALALMYYRHDWAGAAESFAAAMRIDPNYASVHQYYALWLVAHGRFDEALREMQRARELDHLSAIVSTSIGWLLYLAGRHAEAAVSLREDTLATWPTFGVANGVLGQVYLALGRPDDAIRELKISVEQRFPPALAALGHVYGAAGKTREACQVLEQLQQRAEQGRYVSAHDRASVYSGLGDSDRTMDWLQQAYEERSTWLVLAGVHPVFAWLHGDPRFDALLRKVGPVRPPGGPR